MFDENNNSINQSFSSNLDENSNDTMGFTNEARNSFGNFRLSPFRNIIFKFSKIIY